MYVQVYNYSILHTYTHTDAQKHTNINTHTHVRTRTRMHTHAQMAFQAYSSHFIAPINSYTHALSLYSTNTRHS